MQVSFDILQLLEGLAMQLPITGPRSICMTPPICSCIVETTSVLSVWQARSLFYRLLGRAGRGRFGGGPGQGGYFEPVGIVLEGILAVLIG